MRNAPLRRLIEHLRREVWQRRLPHGLLSLRYLWPGVDARIRAHRLLWWHAGAHWPRPLWLLLQLVLYLRWVFISGPWLSFKAWRRWRRNEPACTPPTSLLTLLRLTLGWCIPPQACRQFDLLAHPGQALDYVYDHELKAYHAARSAPLAGTREQAQCLQDKVALTEVLAALGLPMTPILQQIPRDAPATPFIEVLPAPVPVFCKTRSGNQGHNAFAAWPNAEGWAGKAFSGQVLMDTEAVETAWRTLRRRDDVLVQPQLTNHPSLAGLTDQSDAITVRYITRWHAGQIECLHSILEVPLGSDPNTGHTRYGLLPIDPQTGIIGPWRPVQHLALSARGHYDHLHSKIGNISKLPNWEQLVEESHRAQAQFSGIWAIAWDWVLTPEGPRLLEGNVGWGGSVPQQLHGGWLDVPAATELLEKSTAC